MRLLSSLGFGVLLIACSSSSSSRDDAPAPVPEAPAPPGDVTPPPQVPAPPKDWEIKAPRTAFDALALNTKGEIFVAGEILGPTDFGAGAVTPLPDQIAFVAKYSAEGKLAWAKLVAGKTTRQGWSIAADATGGVFIGGLVSEYLDFGGGKIVAGGFMATQPDVTHVAIAHLDASGGHISSSVFLNCQEDCTDVSVAATTKGVAILSKALGRVETETTIYTSGGAFFTWMNTGEPPSTHGLNGDLPIGLASAPDGTVVYASLDTGSDVTYVNHTSYAKQIESWEHFKLDPVGFALDPSDAPAFYMNGSFPSLFPAGSRGDSLVKAKYRDVEWKKEITRATADDYVKLTAHTIAADAKNVVFAGDFSGSISIEGTSLTTGTSPDQNKTDIFVARFSAADGKVAGVRKVGGASRDSVHGIAIASDRRIVVAGESGGHGYLTVFTM